MALTLSPRLIAAIDSSGSATLAFRYTPGSSLTGLGATITRASSATYIDANGVVQTALTDVARDGHYIGGVRTLLLEGQRTNVVLWNRDLTNAAWTKTSCTAAKNQTGADGVATSASSLTATGANATCLQAITLASSARFQSVYVKRITGSGTIQMTTDGGASYTTITVTASWARVSIPTQTLANPSVGFKIVTSGDAVAIDYVQNEDGAFQSSVIATTTTAVTRSMDLPAIPFGPTPRSLTMWIKAIDQGAYASDGNLLSIGNDGASGPTINRFTLSANNGGTGAKASVIAVSNSSATTGVDPAFGDTVEAMLSCDGNGTATVTQSINGAAATTATGGSGTGFGAAFNAQTLYPAAVNNVNSTTFLAIASIKIAVGVRTLAQMEAA